MDYRDLFAIPEIAMAAEAPSVSGRADGSRCLCTANPDSDQVKELTKTPLKVRDSLTILPSIGTTDEPVYVDS